MALRDTARSRTPRQVFGGMLRHYREQAGLTRAELARKICKSESLVQAIELGDRASTIDVTADLDTALNLSARPFTDCDPTAVHRPVRVQGVLLPRPQRARQLRAGWPS